MIDNPLVIDSEQPFGTVPFNEIENADFLPGIKISLKEAKNNIKLIVDNLDKADFHNTILALEMSSEKLDKISTIYFHLFGSESDQEFQSLASEISPILAKYNNDIMLDVDLFKKVEYVYKKIKPELSKQDQKLTEVWYKEFIRNGALLDTTKKDELRQQMHMNFG